MKNVPTRETSSIKMKRLEKGRRFAVLPPSAYGEERGERLAALLCFRPTEPFADEAAAAAYVGEGVCGDFVS
jgi:hypothetical protein